MGWMPLEARDAKFDVGEVVITPAAAAALQATGQTLPELLARHQAGDWGEVSEQLKRVNDAGLTEQFNLQSIYELPCGDRLVVVTDRHRSLTMVHLDVRSN